MVDSFPTALQKLATYRSHNTRASQEIFERGVGLLKSNATNKMGDEGWAFLEQLALASLDVGRIDIADRCLKLLTEKFPGSPRVECLTGIRMEATESPEVVNKYYDELLAADSSNEAVWKRKISILRKRGFVAAAVEELSEFLDTFYTDVEGWLELADIYTSCNQYTFALQALSHALLLNPQNPFYVLQSAETAYTIGDVPLAVKMFLMTVDMTDESDPPSTPTGINVRAWYGVKLCSRRLISEPRLSAASPSHTPAPKNINLIDQLATERVLAAYADSGAKARDGNLAQCKQTVSLWLTAP